MTPPRLQPFAVALLTFATLATAIPIVTTMATLPDSAQILTNVASAQPRDKSADYTTSSGPVPTMSYTGKQRKRSSLGISPVSVAIVVGAGFLLWLWQRIKRNQPTEPTTTALKDTDVARLQLGIKAEAREVQTSLEGTARMADLDSKEGSWDFFQAVIDGLRDNAGAIEHGALDVSEFMTMADAKATFKSWNMQARSRHTREVQHKNLAEDGAPPNTRYFVLTLLVCEQNRGAMPQRIDADNSVVSVLDALSRISTEELVTVEVIWSPPAKSDALGKREMLDAYPELAPI